MLIAGPDLSGLLHPFFYMVRKSDGYYYHLTNGWESYDPTHIASYGIAATETLLTGTYTAANPDTSRAVAFYYLVDAAGSSLATSDIPDNVIWNESTDVPANDVADAVLRRRMSGVETSAVGDALNVSSLYGLIQMAQTSGPASGTALAVYKTDGTTLLGTINLTVSAGAVPVTGTRVA